MNTFYFSIDKEESLTIIQSIIGSTPLQKEDDSDSDEDDYPSPPLYQHKLAVVELYVDKTEILDIEHYYAEIIMKSHKEKKIDYDFSL